jgi:hypothetical protein
LGRPPTQTFIRRKAKQERIAAILELRVKGWTQAEIGAAQDPPITQQSVGKIIQKALDDMPVEHVERLRAIELMRLERLHKAIEEQAESGTDLAAMSMVLSIANRRARLMGLDRASSGGFQPIQRTDSEGGVVAEGDFVDERGVPTVHIIIEGDPETTRRRPAPEAG